MRHELRTAGRPARSLQGRREPQLRVCSGPSESTSRRGRDSRGRFHLWGPGLSALGAGSFLQTLPWSQCRVPSRRKREF